MLCEFNEINGVRTCVFCGRTTTAQGPIRSQCRSSIKRSDVVVQVGSIHIQDGPGTELKTILASLGVEEKPGCDCAVKMNQMNGWGIDRCRERIDEIAGWLREGQGRWGWKDKLAAAAKAATTGIAFKVNWSDPFPGLVELAITRAEDAAKDKGKVDALPV